MREGTPRGLRPAIIAGACELKLVSASLFVFLQKTVKNLVSTRPVFDVSAGVRGRRPVFSAEKRVTIRASDFGLRTNRVSAFCQNALERCAAKNFVFRSLRSRDFARSSEPHLVVSRPRMPAAKSRSWVPLVQAFRQQPRARVRPRLSVPASLAVCPRLRLPTVRWLPAGRNLRRRLGRDLFRRARSFCCWPAPFGLRPPSGYRQLGGFRSPLIYARRPLLRKARSTLGFFFLLL